MSFGIELSREFERLPAQWAKAPQIAAEELLAAMTEADMSLLREIVEATPAASGVARASLFSQETPIPGGVLGVVGSAMPHIIFVELGTKPHFPPLQPLRDWVRMKFGVTEKESYGIAFAIARKIAARGTTGAFMFKNTFARLQPQLERMFERARDRIAARLAQV